MGIEHATGGDCWMDLEGIESDSVQFTSDIANVINEYKVFLFMLTEHSQTSEFALRELNFAYLKAKKDGKKVVILKIDESQMPDELLFMYSSTDIK